MESIRKLSFQEKDGSTMGERVRAVGMVFYEKKDLKLGQTYTLRRQKNNPRDENCLEILDKFLKPKAVVNRDVASLLAPLLDNQKLRSAECVVIEEAKWSRGDRAGKPARAHKIRVSVTSEKLESDADLNNLLEKLRKVYRQID